MTMYEYIIVGGGASGLFFATQAPSHHKKLILEKTGRCGQKVLMSGGERCNLSNENTSPNHYTGTHTQALHSMFKQFSHEEMKNFLLEHNIETKTEDKGRILLKSEKAKQLVDFLITQAQKNNTEICTNHEVISVQKNEDTFLITTNQVIYTCKNLIIATGGKSLPQIGATDIAWSIAQQFDIKTQAPYPCLCGIETKEDMSPITGNSIDAEITIFEGKKIRYTNQGKLLFTHRGLSGPVIFNASIAIGRKDVYTKSTLHGSQIHIIPTSPLPQKIINHLEKNQHTFSIKDLRPRNEAKVTGGGIILSELKPNFESKKVPGLFFLGECIDITGETGGFNLQRCRTSAYNCAKR